MSKRKYRAYDPSQPIETPDDLREWLPDDHLVFLVADIVGSLDLSAITSDYERGDGRGQPPYHPVMMTKLLVYAYCQGVTSSRQIMRKTYEDVAFRIISADQHPDFRTISDFRERHLEALGEVFVQTVRLAQRMGLVRLEHVAQDGSKILANASKHKAMSYERMQEAEERLSSEIERIMEAARAIDEAEDAAYGPGHTGDELPESLAVEVEFREKRLAVIRAAKASLEEEARAEAEAIRAADQAERERREREGEPKKPGRPPNPPQEPGPKAQRNFTDPDSRIMKSSNQGFAQCYNGQAAVDDLVQIIVGQSLTNQANDSGQLIPMVEQVEHNTGQKPRQWSADAGYWGSDDVRVLEQAGTDVYIAPERQKHTTTSDTHLAAALSAVGDEPHAAAIGAEPVDGSTPSAATPEGMRAKLSTPEGRATYGKRMETAEPVFGQIKEGRNLRRFRLRGQPKVQGEWALWCATHNILKIARAVAADGATRARFEALKASAGHTSRAIASHVHALVPQTPRWATSCFLARAHDALPGPPRYLNQTCS